MHRPSPTAGSRAVAMDGQLTLRLLGDPALERIASDGTRTRVLSPGKPLALIAYLAVVPQHEASREFLADLLWGDGSVSDPLHSLRNAILQISKQVDDSFLEVSRSRCRLARTLSSDFGSLTQALGSHDLERVLALYTGQFLSEFAAPGCREFEDWCESIRLRLHSDVANAADVLVRQLLDAGRPRDAERHARRMIALEPLNQRSRRVLLETLIAAGDRMAAFTEAAVTEHWLATESVEPEAATLSLLQQARRVRVATGATGEQQRSPETDAIGTNVDLVGRTSEFSTIINAWETARRGTMAFVSVVAGAGLGKTRLLSDIANRLRAQRAQVVAQSALAGERQIPFSFAAAIVAELGRLPGAAGVSPETGAVLVGLDASLASIFHAPPDFATSDPVLRRARALHELLTCVADERPLIVLLDDLHWCDEASLAVIPAMLARLTASRVLVVATSRSGIGAVFRSERTVDLTLSPLTMEQVAQLIASVRPLPASAWSESLVLSVFTGSRGIPVFVLLALRDLTARGLVRVGDLCWECDEPAKLDASLRDVAPLQSALRDLPALPARVLLPLAVAGRALPLGFLSETEDSPGTLDDALLVLERRGLIQRVGDHASLSHDVVADAVLAGTTPHQRDVTVRHVALRMLDADDAQWHERGIRMLASVATAEELAPRLRPFVESAPIASGVGVARIVAAWLGDSSTQTQLVREVTRLLPIGLRMRPFRSQVAMAGACALLLVAVSAWVLTHPRMPDDATLLAFTATSSGSADVLELPLSLSKWDASTPVKSKPGRSASQLDEVMGGARPSNELLGTAEVLVEHAYGDSGGGDIDVLAGSSPARRLTSSPGDDVPNSWSPDGRFVLFESSRWSSSRHHVLGIMDRESGTTRRLTHAEGREGGGVWSPDGSRIVFGRIFDNGHQPEICVIGMDGSGERCITSEMHLLGWKSVREVLGYHLGRLLALEPSAAWRRDTLSTRVHSPTLSPNGRWLAWSTDSGATAEVVVAPVSELYQARRVRWTTKSRLSPSLSWAPSGGSRPYIEHLTIDGSMDTVLANVPHRFTVSARWSDGTQSAPPFVQWRTSAVEEELIDSLGTLVARHPGVLTVTASAGGWRASSVRVVVVPARAHLEQTVDWANGFAGWHPFGDPLPVLTRDPRLGAALNNNGDGTYFSGAYLQSPLQWEGGLAVDAVVSTRVTELRWQTLDLDLSSAKDSALLSSWDHRTGFAPSKGSGPACMFFFPSAEGSRGLATVLPLAPQPAGAPAARLAIGDGRPYRVRLQIFPDGRCGMAVNGAALWISPDRFDDRVPVRLRTYGNSWNTRMLLGSLTISAGVPGDIDWTRIRSAIPASMPSALPSSGGVRLPK